MKAATEIMNEHKTEVNISIHAAREGGDFLRQLGKSQAVKKFQSTPPVKAATVCSLILNVYAAISIHAAREGGDQKILDEEGEGNISIHAAREGGDCT